MHVLRSRLQSQVAKQFKQRLMCRHLSKSTAGRQSRTDCICQNSCKHLLKCFSHFIRQDRKPIVPSPLALNDELQAQLDDMVDKMAADEVDEDALEAQKKADQSACVAVTCTCC